MVLLPLEAGSWWSSVHIQVAFLGDVFVKGWIQWRRRFSSPLPAEGSVLFFWHSVSLAGPAVLGGW